MKEYDLQIRERLLESGELFGGYNSEMEQVHLTNGRRLKEIMKEIGWPSKGKLGWQARDAAMIIVQHAISMPEFQRLCLQYIEKAVAAAQEDKSNYAFLYDRICFNERRPQKFGTQYDWDENGNMSPWIIENPEVVDDLRRDYGLNPLEEETNAIRTALATSGERPPPDFHKRQNEILQWCRRTGWIK